MFALMSRSDASAGSNACEGTRVLNLELGDRLRAAASLIAEATLERDYARRPVLLDRYGENGRTKYRQDILYNVAELSAGVYADASGMFLRYVPSLKIVLV